MEDLSRSEYPAMLVCRDSYSYLELRFRFRRLTTGPIQANLQPSQAVHAFSERVKRISKQNQEIADWLQVGPTDPESAGAKNMGRASIGLSKLFVF